MKKLSLCLCIAFIVTAFTGCGYTTRALVPEGWKTIYVKPFKNDIDITSEISEKHPLKAYLPGLEQRLTNKVIDTFLIDGHLKTVPEDKADLILYGALTDYDRQALRYTEDFDIEEYRSNVTAKITVRYPDGEVYYKLKNVTLTGDSTYLTTGVLATTEQDAADAAVSDLARRIVDKVVEAGW